MAWIETHQALVTHYKTSTLCGELAVRKPAAIGHLVMLWCWALDNARDGNLTHISYRAIADAAGWSKKPETFVLALRRSGFICSGQCEHEPPDGVVVLHDWMDYAGRLIDKRTSDAKRKREKRTSVGHPADGAGTQPAPNSTDSTDPTNAAAARALRAWENCGGSLTQTIAEKIQAELSEGTDAAWIEAACEEAATNNARSWNYVEAILDRWKREGFKAGRNHATATRPDPKSAVAANGRAVGGRTPDF